MRQVKEPTGTARYEDGKLTIITEAVRGKKTVKLKVVYVVTDLAPDRRVANPAFRLTKDNGEFYDVALMQYGPVCSCPHATFRGANSRVPCKHCKALAAVGLLRKYEDQEPAF